LAAGSVLHQLPALSQRGRYENWDQLSEILNRLRLPEFRARNYPVTNYGADKTGSADSRRAFNEAIKACNMHGGGRVVVPAGTFRVDGPIRLLSNVNFHMEKGALVQFGTDPDDYLPLVEVRWGGVRCLNYSPLIYAHGANNIAITGQGIFDGQAAAGFGSWAPLDGPDTALLQQMAGNGVPVGDRIFGTGHYLRPTMLEPYKCRNVWIDGVTFKGSPFWTIHPTFCENVVVSNVTVLPGVANDDGCDPDSCKNVLLDNCAFNTVDDSVSIKAGMAPDSDSLPGTENVLVLNCSTLASTFGGFTIGSNVSAGIRNIFVDNYSANNCVNPYLIKGNRNLGGFVANVEIRNSKALQVHHLLTLLPGAYGTTAAPVNSPGIGPILMRNTICENASVSGFAFTGLKQNPIEGIVLTDIAIKKSPKLITSTFTGVKSHGVTFEGQPVTIDETA
jgi:polygalacturonase